MIFAIHQHELATGIHVSPSSWMPFHLPPHPIPLGCPRAPALGALLRALNLHWPSILHMVMYMFQCYPLTLFLFVFFKFISNWRKIALQCCVGFAVWQQKSAIIIHISPFEPPRLPPPTSLGHRRAPGWAPSFIWQLLTSYLTYGKHLTTLLSPFIPLLASPTVYTSPFSISASPFLPSK